MASFSTIIWTIRLIFTLLIDWFAITFSLLFGSKTVWLTILFATSIGIFLILDPPLPPPQPEIIYEVDRQAAETHIAFWQNLTSITPNRDGFLNLEKLYNYLEETDTARQYRYRAFQLDPNNQIFANDNW